jgi:outer membrane protein assembly factor BamB
VLDEWTHLLHDVGGTRASSDETVGAARYIQFVSGPPYSMKPRLVSHGRMVVLEMDVRSQSRRMDIRDARNGMLLWSRRINLPKAPRLPSWGWGESHSQSDTNTLAARGRHLYVLEQEKINRYDLETSALDASYPSSGAYQILVAEKELIAVGVEQLTVFEVANGEQRWQTKVQGLDIRIADGHLIALDGAKEPFTVRAFKLADGADSWSYATTPIWPEGHQSTLHAQAVRLCGARDGRVLVWAAAKRNPKEKTGHNLGGALVCLDLQNGQERWRFQPTKETDRAVGPSNHVVYAKDVVYTLVSADVEVENKGKKQTQWTPRPARSCGVRRTASPTRSANRPGPRSSSTPRGIMCSRPKIWTWSANLTWVHAQVAGPAPSPRWV